MLKDIEAANINPETENNANEAVLTETHETLINRLKILEELLIKAETFVSLDDSEIQEERVSTYVFNLSIIARQYTDFLQGVMDKRFDFIPEIAKFKGLLSHDLLKPGKTVGGIVNVFEGLPSPVALKIFIDLKSKIKDQLSKIKGALAIIKSINSASYANETPRISLKTLVNLLGLSFKDEKYLLQKSTKVGTEKFYINTEIKNQLVNSDQSLTIEEFFTLSTLLLNLVPENCNNAKVEITEDEGYRFITVYDDIGNEWPNKVEETFNTKYPYGYANPEQPLETNEGGLGMVFLLAGQRHRKAGVPTSQQFVEYKNVAKGESKYIRVKFKK